MRAGHMLAQSPPEALLQAHHLSSLEDVFLKLCQADQSVDGKQTITASAEDGRGTSQRTSAPLQATQIHAVSTSKNSVST